MRQLLPSILFGVSCVVAVALAVVLALPAERSPQEPVVQASQGPLPQRAERPDRAERKLARQATREARRAELLAQRKERRVAQKEREVREPRLAPEDRADARLELRELQLEDLLARHDAYAAERGWSNDLTDAVAVRVAEGAEEVSHLLELVDRGEVPWEEVRADLRDVRLEQAKAVQALLGEQGFADWSGAMGFQRFSGEEWVRGRVDGEDDGEKVGRRAEGARGPRGARNVP